jgi:putative addiction module component (TIGR02574 family)
VTQATRDLLKRVLELPRAERAALVREVLADLRDGEEDDPAEVERAWAAEALRRVRDLDSGRVKPIAGAKVLAELRAAQAKDEKRRRPRRRA